MTDEKMITYTDDEGNRIAIIGKTKVIYKKMSADEKTRELAEMREKALHIEATEKSFAIAEGERRKEAEILAKMRKSGLSEEQIKAILNS